MKTLSRTLVAMAAVVAVGKVVEKPLRKKIDEQLSAYLDEWGTVRDEFDMETVSGTEHVKVIKVEGFPIALIAGAYYNATDKESYVLVDDNFDDLSTDQAREFVLQHELGHIYYAHGQAGIFNRYFMNLYRSATANFSSSVIKDELQADAYAADKVGTEAAVGALGLLDELVIQLTGNHQREITARAEAVAKLAI